MLAQGRSFVREKNIIRIQCQEVGPVDQRIPGEVIETERLTEAPRNRVGQDIPEVDAVHLQIDQPNAAVELCYGQSGPVRGQT